MENGVGNADGAQLEEAKGGEGEVREAKVEERVPVGFHERKESEGDEVFEEAVGASVDSEDRVVSDDKSRGEVGDLGVSLEVDQNLINVDELETFEEAIGVSGSVLTSGEGVEEKEGVLMSELPSSEAADQSRIEILNRDREFGEEADEQESNKAPREILNGDQESGKIAELLATEESPIVEQDASDKVLVDGGEELKIDAVRDDGENETSHAVNLDGVSGTVKSKVEDEVNEMSGEFPEKPVNGVGHHVNVNLIQDGIDADKQENKVHGLPETQDANEVKGGVTDSGQDVESNGYNVHQDVMNIKVNEMYGTPDTGHKKNTDFENSAASQVSENEGDVIDVQKGGTINLNDEQREDETPELEDKKTISMQPENRDKQKRVSAISTVAVNNQQEYATLKDNICTSVEEKTEKSEFKPVTLDDSSVEERTKAPKVEESPPLEDASAKEVGKVSLISSTSTVGSSGGAEAQLAKESGGVSEVVVNQPEKKADKDDEAKQSIPSSRGEEVKPVMDNSSSTAPSPSPTPVPVPAPAPAPASTPARPAGLGRAAPLLEPAPRVVQQPRVNGAASATQNQLVEEPTNGETEEYDETREKLQMIRVKFLRLAHRLGQTPHNVVVAQVLYRLGLAEQLRGRNGGRVAAFSFDRASAMAEQLEAAGQEPLDFSCTIMVLGKTGVGKSATINSIFDEVKFGTDAFQSGTKKVQDVVGTVQGITVRVIDTPGLLPSWSDQRQNERILHSVKRFIKKTPPDIVLYLDRLDMQSRDFGDMPLLRTITEIFGPSIWFNAIVVLTHAASAPPEGPNGTATSYDMFVTQRSHAVQQAIRQAAGDMRLMNPVSLVENHSACRTNRAGQRVLPNGQVWKPHLLLLSFASKILAEANTLLKLQDSPPGRPFATRTRAPPLPFLLSSLLQSRPQIKLPTDQFGEDDDSHDDDVDDDSDSEDESEYDQLPPFRSMTKAQLAKLPRDQRKAYYAELEYREKLFMKKQLKEDKKRRKMMKKMQAMDKESPADHNESAEEESGGAASVPVPMPDLALPASFDSDNPTHRYRCLDSSNQWLVRPVLEPNGWDHDVGYEGINVERLFAIKDKVPVSFSGQVSKDKKDTNLQMEVATSVKHGEGKATSLGFDMQSVGKDIAYTVRGETRFINYRRNKATTGLSVTILGDTITGGVKVEDRLIVNKRGQVVVSGGAMFGRGDVAYGGSLEATLRDKDHPLGRFLSTLGLSVMDWHGDLAIGCNSQTQIPIGRYTNLIGRVNINNKGSGQVSIRLNSSEQLQIALIALIPFARKLLGYSQQSQFGQ